MLARFFPKFKPKLPECHVVANSEYTAMIGDISFKVVINNNKEVMVLEIYQYNEYRADKRIRLEGTEANDLYKVLVSVLTKVSENIGEQRGEKEQGSNQGD
jgi:hypothetical protein